MTPPTTTELPVEIEDAIVWYRSNVADWIADRGHYDVHAAEQQLRATIATALAEAATTSFASGEAAAIAILERGCIGPLRERCERLRTKVLDTYADIYAAVDFEELEGLQPGDLADNLRPQPGEEG